MFQIENSLIICSLNLSRIKLVYLASQIILKISQLKSTKKAFINYIYYDSLNTQNTLFYFNTVSPKYSLKGLYHILLSNLSIILASPLYKYSG